MKANDFKNWMDGVLSALNDEMPSKELWIEILQKIDTLEDTKYIPIEKQQELRDQEPWTIPNQYEPRIRPLVPHEPSYIRPINPDENIWIKD